MVLPLVPLESYEWVRCGLWTKIGIGKNQHARRAMSTSANTQEQDEKRAISHEVFGVPLTGLFAFAADIQPLQTAQWLRWLVQGHL